MSDSTCGKHRSRVNVDGRTDYLSRAVWEAVNGPIPAVYHIHHIDLNMHNNDLSNLECVLPVIHRGEHGHQGTLHICRCGQSYFYEGIYLCSACQQATGQSQQDWQRVKWRTDRSDPHI